MVTVYGPIWKVKRISLFAHRRAIAIPAPCTGAPMAALPRNRLAASATGGASAISPFREGVADRLPNVQYPLCRIIANKRTIVKDGGCGFPRVGITMMCYKGQ